jgi:small GTP-binding protein
MKTIEKVVKVVVAGPGGVGKTCFLNRLVNNEFNNNSELTKGVDFFSKTVSIDGIDFNFILWDFAGQDQFKSLLDEFIGGSIAAFVLFDMTRLTTIESVYEWIKQFQTLNIPTLILGTKQDLIHFNDSSFVDDYILEIKNCNKNVIGYFKVSSKTGYNITNAFDYLVENFVY